MKTHAAVVLSGWGQVSQRKVGARSSKGGRCPSRMTAVSDLEVKYKGKLYYFEYMAKSGDEEGMSGDCEEFLAVATTVWRPCLEIPPYAKTPTNLPCLNLIVNKQNKGENTSL